MPRLTSFVDRIGICVRNAILRTFYPICNPFLRLFFYLIGNPGSSDHSVSVSVFTCLYLILHASSTETKQELVVDFHGKDWHVEMLWRKDATYNETFVVLKQVKLFGHDLGPSQRNLARFIDERVERRHINIFDIGVFICLGMHLKGLGSTADKKHI